MTNSRRRRDPGQLTPREAKERYLRRRSPDSTEQSIEGWHFRLKLFVEWCESVGLETVGELRGFDIDEYYELRSAEVAPSTLEGEMWTLKMFCEFLEDIEAVEQGLADAVRIPDLDAEDRTNDTKLATEDALALLRFYRKSESYYGMRQHAVLELLWLTGARQGGLRALDIRDVHLGEDPYVEFRHRPETGTPLKNKRQGERPVALTPVVADVLEAYLETHRYDVRDEHGRQPFLASAKGRPTPNTLRTWTYLGTQPCLHSPCPHGKDRPSCEWTNYHHGSKCPSSRSPHQIRTGAITWMLNQGWPPEDVAERVNAAVETIEKHYDVADIDELRRRKRDRMETRRRDLVTDLDIAENDDDE